MTHGFTGSPWGFSGRLAQEALIHSLKAYSISYLVYPSICCTHQMGGAWHIVCFFSTCDVFFLWIHSPGIPLQSQGRPLEMCMFFSCLSQLVTVFHWDLILEFPTVNKQHKGNSEVQLALARGTGERRHRQQVTNRKPSVEPQLNRGFTLNRGINLSSRNWIIYVGKYSSVCDVPLFLFVFTCTFNKQDCVLNIIKFCLTFADVAFSWLLCTLLSHLQLVVAVLSLSVTH